MTESSGALLKATPLNATHRALGARMVGFAGWEMPLDYAGVSEEHNAVRTRAGLFDVSHMGEIEIVGKDALAAVQRVGSNDAAKLAIGQAQYSALMTVEGTLADDLLVYRLADDHYMCVVNAANTDKDFAHIRAQIEPVGDAVAVNASSRYALLAFQGPSACAVLQPLTGVDLGAVKPYRFAAGEVAGVKATVSRTGYTGEDGFELFVAPQFAARVWDAILQAGASAGVVPVGLAARDTLRLEAGMRLYGNEMDETTTVLECGLNWVVGWEKPDFLGADALRRQKTRGVTRKLVGFEMVDRAIARHGYPVVDGDATIGCVTSGTQTPFLKKPIGMAYVPAERTEPGEALTIGVRGRRAAARVVSMPFYKRPRS